MAANNTKDQLITSESKIAFNCVYDLYFVRIAPDADPAEACKFLSQFHPVTPEELPQLKAHILQASVLGKTVIEYMRNKHVRLCAKYIGPRPVSEAASPAPRATAPHAASHAAAHNAAPIPLPSIPQPTNTNAASKKMARSLKAHGVFFCSLGIFGMGLIALGIVTALIVLAVCFISSGQIYFFEDEIAGPFWGLAFGFLGLGSYMTPLYLIGLHFQGQSQIISNTEH